MDVSSSSPNVSRKDPATILLDRVSESERGKLIKDLISSLDPEDQASIIAVARLVERSAQDDTTRWMITFLESMMQIGHVQSVVAICRRHPRLGISLLEKSTDMALGAKSESNQSLQSHLLFSASFASSLPWDGLHSQLLAACLDLLQSPSHDIHTCAKNTVLELLTVSQPLAESKEDLQSEDKIWLSVKLLIESNTKLHTATAYALWLRWLLSDQSRATKETTTDEYWQLLRYGLRNGDTEQRKLCLNILRISVSIDQEAFPMQLAQQYERYATVFETVVLSRYINQIVECEQDLNYFAERSDLDSSWTYILLGSALDGRMQEANRKFIGNWIMRSNLNLGFDTLNFLRNDFLPWAIQGQHFVATLRTTGDEVVCQHGQDLADYIRRMRDQSSDHSLVTDIVIDTILRKKNTMFAYCTVWLLDGLHDSINLEQKRSISEHRGLPEVAREYVMLRTSNDIGHTADAKVSTRKSREKSAMEKIQAFVPSAASLQDIWNDVEYLEFPKRLLMAFVDPLLSNATLETALENAELAATISDKVGVLQQIALTKTFLFSPLVAALRRVVLTIPATAKFLAIAGFILMVAQQPPEPNIDIRLEESIIHLTPHSYEYYFGERLGYGMAAYLDLVSRLRDQQQIVGTVRKQILSKWRSQKIPPPTVSAWKTTLQLQVLLLCCEQDTLGNPSDAHPLLEDLFHILAIEPLPNYRYLLEATIVRIILRLNIQGTIIERLKTKDHHSNPKHLASLMKIGGILVSTTDTSEDFAELLMTVFVPLAASSKIVIRHEAQWQVPLLMDRARVKRWTSITDNKAVSALDEYIRSLERFHDPPPERVAGRFDPETDHTLTNLAEGKWYALDQLDAPLASREDFIKLYEQYPLPSAPPTCLGIGPPVSRPHANHQPQPQSSNQSPGPQNSETVTLALQTKGTAYLSRALTSLTASLTRPQPNLFIVGSLVDNPYNLGGLSRVSEIFGAAALTLQNKNVVGNKDFTSVAVSSHLHLPIVQLSAGGVPAYLRERRKEGFVVVGIEQTDRSVILGSPGAKLPEKCVLVVGSEREGIPASVLVECDVLVEIRQEGVTRSLNVQTAVAIVLFEYSRQHGGSPPAK